MTSGTKYIGGHGDVTLGVLAVRGEELATRVYFLQVGGGARRHLGGRLGRFWGRVGGRRVVRGLGG